MPSIDEIIDCWTELCRWAQTTGLVPSRFLQPIVKGFGQYDSESFSMVQVHLLSYFTLKFLNYLIVIHAINPCFIFESYLFCFIFSATTNTISTCATLSSHCADVLWQLDSMHIYARVSTLHLTVCFGEIFRLYSKFQQTKIDYQLYNNYLIKVRWIKELCIKIIFVTNFCSNHRFKGFDLILFDIRYYVRCFDTAYLYQQL